MGDEYVSLKSGILIFKLFVWMKLWGKYRIYGISKLKFHWYTLIFTQSEKISRINYLPKDGLSF